MNGVLGELRKVVLRGGVGGLTDGQLLEHFLAHREEGAFTALVDRHGRMVMGVCRRVLQHVHDAEDAFQATFLVLARKAATVAPPDAVGAWLYGVAYRTAKKAKAMTARRRLKEQQYRETRGAVTTPEDAWEELQPLLDEELSRLPERYRSAIVLCDLEGKTKKEAASQLRCPEGTLSSRLVRGRRMLARRLAHRGVTLSAGLLAVMLVQQAASAAVRAGLVDATGKAATLFGAGQAAAEVSSRVAALTEGVLKAMYLSKLKMVLAVLLVVGVLGALAAYWSRPAEAARPQADKDARAEQPDPKDRAAAEQIARVMKAHGGEENLRRLKTFTFKVDTSSTLSSHQFTFHFFIQLPNQVRLEANSRGTADQMGKMISVMNGDKIWQKVNDGKATEGPKRSEEAKEALEFLGPRALLRLTDPAMKVVVLGERMAGDTAALLGDRAAICVELSRKDGKKFFPPHALIGHHVSDVRLYFDKDSGLLLKEEFADDTRTIEIFYGEYKVVKGFPVAQKLVRRTDGSVNYRSEVEFNIVDRLDAKLFEKP